MSLPYFPMYPSDFEAKTSHLTLEEDGAYNRLLRLCWMMPDCSLPDDPTWIARRMRVDMDTFNRVVAPLLDEFFQRAKGRVFNRKLTEVYGEANEKHERRVEAGKKGGRPAKSLETNETTQTKAKAKPKQPEPEPEPKRKEEEDAQARTFDSDFFESLRDTLGVQSHTAYWSDISVQPHVDAWRADGLTDDAILSAAKASRDKNPSPPDGPKALDRWMEQTARAAQKPKSGPVMVKPASTETEVLAFWAERINGGGYVAPSSITPITARRLIELGLVQPETLKQRGIAA